MSPNASSRDRAFGGGGFGGGGFGGGALGGMGGGGLGGGDAAATRRRVTPGFSELSAGRNLQALPPGPPAPAAEQPPAPAADPFAAQAGTLPNAAAEPAAPMVQEAAEAQPSRTADRATLRKGVARLSIRAEVTAPDDYRSRTFRSIGDADDSAELKLLLLSDNDVRAMRVIAAVLVLLWLLRRSQSADQAWLKLIAGAVAIVIVTGGLIPLIPDRWQSLADGVVWGTAAAVVIRSVGAIVRTGAGVLRWCAKVCRIRGRHSVAAAALLALTICGMSSSQGQSADDQPPARPNVVRPYTPGRPELLAERVLLSAEDFLKLYREAFPQEFADGGIIPQPGVTAAVYQSGERRPVRDSLYVQRFSARYVIQTFNDAETIVTLPLGTVAVHSATLDGQPAVLQPRNDRDGPPVTPLPQHAEPQTQSSSNQVLANPVPANQSPANQLQQQVQAILPPQPVREAAAYQVRVSGSGVHLLDLEFDVRADIEGPTGKLKLPLRPVASGILTFTLPDDHLSARVNGRSNTFRQNERTLTIPVSSAATTEIEWRPESVSGASDNVFHAVVNSAWILNDAGITLKSAVRLEVRQGRLAEVELHVPSDYAVQKVIGTEVAGWNADEADRSRLRVLFRRPVEQSTTIDVTLFRVQEFEAERTLLEVPVPSVAGASRDTGNVTVLAGRELDVRVHSLSGVSQVNPADAVLPGDIDENQRRVLSWRYTRHPVEIRAHVFRVTDRMTVTALHGVQLESQRQLWTSLVSADISGSPRRRLELTVPKSFLALDVETSEPADWYFTEPAEFPDQRLLNIQFHAAQSGQVYVTIQGQTDRDSDAQTASLNAPQILQADELTSQMSVWLDAASEISGVSGADWKRTGSETSVDGRILKLQSNRPDISFISRRTVPGAAVLQLRPATAVLLAESVLITNVTDTSLELTLALNWQIARAGVRQLSFALPSELADALDFRIPGLRQLEISDPDAGAVRYT
ncbi:MAG: hypothetical protein KDA89_22105, partial [Planctomycetaceae bacterium]|nr:hypothetical protein [Planctomycetaceae bacterium]